MQSGGTEPATAQLLQAGERRVARLESLRALAAVAVAVGHAWGYAHGFGVSTADDYFGRVIYGGGFGLYVFFALTGYLIFWPFVRRELGDGSPVALGDYARNRMLRILPLYFFAVVVLIILREGGGTLGMWVKFLTLTENFDRDTIAGVVNPVAWSVVVEMHFYALLPLIAVGLGRIAKGSRLRAGIALIVLEAFFVAVHLVTVTLDEPADPLWRYNLPATFMFFIPGMLLAVLRLEFQERRPAWLDGPLGSPATWMLAGCAVFLVIVSNYQLTPLSALGSFLLVGSCCLPLREHPLRRSLDWRPLAALGTVTYSFYIWHLPIQEFFYLRVDQGTGFYFAMVLALVLAIVAAFISYRYVESPFLRMRRRWSKASAVIEQPAPRAEPAPAGTP